MIIQEKNYRTDVMYVTVAALAVALSWFLHEGAHWTAGTLLGYEMAMTLNTAYPLSGGYASASDEQIVSAAGPVLTLVEAVLVFYIMRRTKAPLLYSFLFTCFYSRLMAGVISVFNPNDEARISRYLGIGTFTLPLIMTGVLFYLLYRTAERYGFSKKFNALNLALVILFSSLIILGDQYFHIRLR